VVAVPARKRHRREPEHPDPLVRFSRAVKETDAKRKEQVRKEQEAKREAARQRKLAAERKRAIEQAERRVDKAIAAAKAARASGHGIAEADEEWKAARAALIELETGQAPDW
jgi:esterase/lipase